MGADRELDSFRTYVRNRGLRMTSERLALFEEIFSRHEHVDADRLHQEMCRKGLKISRATVYRGLDLLEECGLVRKQKLDRHRVLYEHLHAGLQHDHMVCRECGRVVEFVSPRMRELQAELCQAHGFDPDETSLHLTGECLTCRRARELLSGEGRE